MIFRRSVGGVFLVASLLALSGCSGGESESGERSAEVRYRMTVEVETPEGIRSGSSVWSFTLSRPTVALTTPFDYKFKGEAVAVDLPGERTLFALVSGQEMLPERHFRELDGSEGMDRIAHLRSISNSIGATATIPCKSVPENASSPEQVKIEYDCPMLVTFKDIKDPTSVEPVNPSDLAKSFGEGYRLKAVTMQVTDKPVTRGIDKRLGWLDSLDKYRTDPINPFTNTLPNEIGGLQIGVEK